MQEQVEKFRVPSALDFFEIVVSSWNQMCIQQQKLQAAYRIKVTRNLVFKLAITGKKYYYNLTQPM